MFGSSVRLDDLHDEDTNVYWRPALDRGAVLEGPALVEQYDELRLRHRAQRVLSGTGSGLHELERRLPLLLVSTARAPSNRAPSRALGR